MLEFPRNKHLQNQDNGLIINLLTQISAFNTHPNLSQWQIYPWPCMCIELMNGPENSHECAAKNISVMCRLAQCGQCDRIPQKDYVTKRFRLYSCRHQFLSTPWLALPGSWYFHLHGIQYAITDIVAAVVRKKGTGEDDSTKASGGVGATDYVVLVLGGSGRVLFRVIRPGRHRQGSHPLLLLQLLPPDVVQDAWDKHTALLKLLPTGWRSLGDWHNGLGGYACVRLWVIHVASGNGFVFYHWPTAQMTTVSLYTSCSWMAKRKTMCSMKVKSLTFPWVNFIRTRGAQQRTSMLQTRLLEFLVYRGSHFRCRLHDITDFDPINFLHHFLCDPIRIQTLSAELSQPHYQNWL